MKPKYNVVRPLSNIIMNDFANIVTLFILGKNNVLNKISSCNNQNLTKSLYISLSWILIVNCKKIVRQMWNTSLKF
jgi:hypothetical protein